MSKKRKKNADLRGDEALRAVAEQSELARLKLSRAASGK